MAERNGVPLSSYIPPELVLLIPEVRFPLMSPSGGIVLDEDEPLPGTWS